MECSGFSCFNNKKKCFQIIIKSRFFLGSDHAFFVAGREKSLFSFCLPGVYASN